MALAETANLVVQLSLRDKFTGPMRKVEGGLGRLDRATSNTQRALGRTAQNLERAFVGGALLATGALAGTVRAAADYESAFAGVRKTVEATEPQLAALSDTIRGMSREMPIAATELAALGEAGGALGIATDNLDEFIRVTALLGVTTDLSSEQAAESLGVLSNVLKLTGDDYDNFASSLVALGNAGASTESAIIQVAQRMGAAGKLVGLATDQVLGFASAAASLDPSSIEASGTALQKFFIDTTKAVASGGDELKVLAKTAGVSAKSFAKAFDKDAGRALQDFLAGLGKLDKAAQLGVLEDLGFNDARITRVLLGLANNTELVAEQMGLANSAFRENTALSKEAGERFKTFDSQLQIAKNTLNDVAITIGSKLLPKLTPLLQRFGAFVNANQGGIAKFGEDLANGFSKFADEVERTDFSGLIGGLQLAAQAAKLTIDAFRALPGPLQQILVGAFAVNKLTGGLVTGIGKDLALGAFGKLRGQTPATPMYVSMVGAGGVGGVVGGKGGAGKLGTGLSVLTAVTGVGAAVAQQQEQSAMNSEIAVAVRQTGEAYVRENRLSAGQIRDAIAAVDQGINQIQANPLHVLVQGSALEELRATKAHLQQQLTLQQSAEAHRGESARQMEGGLAAIASAQRTFNHVYTAGERVRAAGIAQATAATRETANKTVASFTTQASHITAAQREGAQKTQATLHGQGIARAVEAFRTIQAQHATAQAARETRGAVQATRGTVAAGTSRIVSALYATRPVVNISATNIIRTASGAQRYGRQSGSRQTGRVAL